MGEKKKRVALLLRNGDLLRTPEASVGCALHVKITVVCGLAIKGLRLPW